MLNDVPRQSAEAAEALKSLQASADETARGIDEAFAAAGESLARSLARAAADGEISLAELARAVLAAIDAAVGGAGRSGGGGLGEALAQIAVDLARGATTGGAGEGGAAGAPPASLRAAPLNAEAPLAAGTTINVTVQGEGRDALFRSEAQIAQALARATLLGVRR